MLPALCSHPSISGLYSISVSSSMYYMKRRNNRICCCFSIVCSDIHVDVQKLFLHVHSLRLYHLLFYLHEEFLKVIITTVYMHKCENRVHTVLKSHGI